MELLTAIMKIIGLVTFCIIAVVIVIFFGGFIFATFAAFIALFALAWAVGIPISIKSNGEKIGYVRWFTFYRKF